MLVRQLMVPMQEEVVEVLDLVWMQMEMEKHQVYLHVTKTMEVEEVEVIMRLAMEDKD